MQPERWSRIKSVFDAAVLIDTERRAAYLDNACSGDDDLRREVESLLAASDSSEGFLEMPFAGEIAHALLDEDAELKPGEVFGRYKITRSLGRGGMGSVYLAEDTELKRPVAIKILSHAANFDAEQVSRFVQEARLASLLNHPNILTIFEIGQSDDVHFITTEFVSGETLRSCIGSGRIQIGRAVDVAIDIASALVVAHRAGVVHRDIKPENVMLREDGLLKVLDFGVAKLSRIGQSITWDGDVKTQPGFVLGTPAYMSPEQAMGTDVDARTDVWSLGVILYEMVVGHPPFEGSTPAKVIRSIVEGEPKELTDVPATLRKMLGKALNKDADERYQSMEAFVDALRSFRTELETGVAEPPSVAILPFRNVTRDQHLDFFEFALADAIITELGRTGGPIVRPSASIAKYIGEVIDPVAIGRELGVDAILSANFVVSNKRIRITTQLIDVNEKNVLWSEQIDSDTDDIIALQDEITTRIVSGLKCELETRPLATVAVPRTHSSVAYVEYLRGRDQLRRFMFQTVANENVEIAIRHFERAIELDPEFALAHCGLGTSYLQKVVKIVGVQSDLDKAAASLDRALDLDGSITEARAYWSFVWRLKGEVEKSRTELSRLRRDAANNFEVQYMSAVCYRLDGEYDKAFACYRRMLRIDPTAQVTVHFCRARLFLFRGEFDLAIRELDGADKIEPHHPVAKFFRAIATFRSGDPAAAVEQMSALFTAYPCRGFRSYLSICLSAIGEREAALRELTDEVKNIAAVDPDVSYWVASAYVAAGQRSDGLDWLERSVGLGNRDFAWFERDPVLEPVRSDPRYLNLISRLKHNVAVV